MKTPTWRRVAAAALVGLWGLSCLSVTGCTPGIKWKIEAGDDLPDPFELLGEEGGAYVDGYDPTIVNRPGTYELFLQKADGKQRKVVLTVVDTTEPVVTAKHVYYARGGQAPQAADFIDTIEEVDTFEAYFEGDAPTVDTLGDFDVTFRVKDASGNVSDECHSVYTVVEDATPPTFVSLPPISTYLGASVDYLDGVVATDDCVGEVTVSVDDTAINMAEVGTYTVTYTATDARGNITTEETTLRVYPFNVSVEQVYAAVDAILQSVTTADMTTTQRLEAVHRYFLPTRLGSTRPIQLVGDAGHTDRVRAAYEALHGDKEADAFGCASVAMAVCERLGLEARMVQRQAGVSADEHYWVMVNIGTERKPRWYHWDLTPLRIQPANNGCLMTDDQLQAYNKQRPGFYVYDTDAYPASAKEAYEPSLKSDE